MHLAYESQPIELRSVDLRDGKQMFINETSIEQDLEAFDAIVRTGITKIEVGHAGNASDQQLFQAVFSHIQEKEQEDSRYANVNVQALVSTQQEVMEAALEALSGFDKDRIIVHIYDRLSPNLRALAERPYDAMESARRVCYAMQQAIEAGFTNFSVSGEGATDTTVDEALEFYGHIGEYAQINEISSFNANLANTPGSPPEGEWDAEGLSYFCNRMRERVPTTTITVHPHNDDGSANEFTIAAIKAGFGGVEGTIIGMGERCGNVTLSNVIIRLLEIARFEVESTHRPMSTFRIGRAASANTLFSQRSLPSEIVDGLSNWYSSSQSIARIYGTEKSFQNTSLGDPESYNAGSGPHDHASKRALQNPAKWPLWRNYLRIALIHSMLGRPEAEGIIAADPIAIKEITVNGHAGGGSTQAIVNGAVERVDSQATAVEDARQLVREIIQRVR